MTAFRTLSRKVNIRQILPATSSIKVNLILFTRSFSLTRPASYRVSQPRLTTDANKTDENDVIYDREFVDMHVEDFKDLYADDPSKKILIETILNEYEFIKYNSLGRVPSVIYNSDMGRIIEECPTERCRSSFFHFLFKREMDKRAEKRRRQQKKEVIYAKKIAKFGDSPSVNRSGLLSESGELIYGLWHNSLFCRIPDTKLKSGSSASRLRNAALFGRKLIFDFDFEDYMMKWTYRNALEQVQVAYGLNRFMYPEPFDIWFCNFKSNSFAAEYCGKHALRNLRDTSMITIKEDCFTNHFDRSRLVYLSPNAKEPLGKIHKNDDIYIIGVYNDKGNAQPVTYSKAKKLGIRAKCLPLDSHVSWASSSKSLCVNHVTGILLEVLENGGDWHAALLKHIPSRKIKPMELVVEEERKKLENIRRKTKTPIFSLRNDFD